MWRSWVSPVLGIVTERVLWTIQRGEDGAAVDGGEGVYRRLRKRRAPQESRGSAAAQNQTKYAGVAELADALDLGSSVTHVQVQVLSPAPYRVFITDLSYGHSIFL